MAQREPIYKRRQGYALILNNVFIGVKDYERKGSDKDVELMDNTLKGLGFEVIKRTEKTTTEIKQIVEDCAKLNHKDNYCFVGVFMSHGTQEGLEGLDGELISIHDICQPFIDADSLKGKPKIFFFQACRGKTHMLEAIGDEVKQANNNPNFDNTTPPRENQQPSSVNFNQKPSDVISQFSCVNGYYAYRNESGSYFIQCLTEALIEMAESDHLFDILTEVNNRLAQKRFRYGDNWVRLMSEIKTSLKGKVYLR